MYSIKADTRKNRLYIKLAGFLADDEIQNAADEVTRAIASLQPNMTIITDISEFKPVSPHSAVYIKDAQAAAFHKGVKHAVSIVSNPIAGMQFKRTQREAGAKYEVLEASSVEEAERLLDELT